MKREVDAYMYEILFTFQVSHRVVVVEEGLVEEEEAPGGGAAGEQEEEEVCTSTLCTLYTKLLVVAINFCVHLSDNLKIMYYLLISSAVVFV